MPYNNSSQSLDEIPETSTLLIVVIDALRHLGARQPCGCVVAYQAEKDFEAEPRRSIWSTPKFLLTNHRLCTTAQGYCFWFPTSDQRKANLKSKCVFMSILTLAELVRPTSIAIPNAIVQWSRHPAPIHMVAEYVVHATKKRRRRRIRRGPTRVRRANRVNEITCCEKWNSCIQFIYC